MPRVLRLLLFCLGGMSFVLWAGFDPRFRDAEGFLRGEFCLPVAVGMALLISGWAASGNLKKSACWFALALVGQAVALQLIEAGPFLRYQHYKPLSRLVTETHPLLPIFLAAQTALVVVGLRGRWPKIRAWLGSTFNRWQLLSVALVFILTSATVSRDVATYLAEIVFAALVQIVSLGNILLMVWALPEEALAGLQRRLDKWIGQPDVEDRESKIENRKSKIQNSTVDRFVILAALWVGILAAGFSWFVYQAHPHIEDEIIYLYHARYLSEGVLTVPAPPVPEAFSFYLIPHEAGRWFSIFPPGWPAMLAVGVFLGVAWLVNPVLASLNVLLSYAVLRKIYSRRAARMAVLLLALSPWFVFMGMNFMAHTFTLTCALVATLAVIRARNSGSSTWGLIAGCAVGVVSLIRPLDGLVVGGLLGLWAIGFGERRLKVSSILTFALGAAAVAAVVLPYNRQITGNPTEFPLMAYYEKYFGPKTNALGFGPERGLNWPIDPFPGHSPLDALINANLNVFSINVELFGWITGSLLMVVLLLFSGKLRRSDYFMLAVVVALAGVFSFYWFSGGPDFGARYWYLMVVPLVALTARGIEFLETTFKDASQSARVMAAVLTLSVLALVNFFPWRAIDKYHHYLGMRPDIRYLEKQHGFGKSIVLIRGNLHPDYHSAWVYNPSDPYAEVPVYAWDRNAKVRAQLLRAYPDRPVWIVNGPSITRGGFQVVAGPLSARDLAAQGS
jgi:4-amino-4-deoxy-L-arabinose transferase-like glycosyltransferase